MILRMMYIATCAGVEAGIARDKKLKERESEIFDPIIKRTLELLIKFDYQQRAMLGAK